MNSLQIGISRQERWNIRDIMETEAAMNIQRVGHRYRDVETEKTIDVWFPASNSRMDRHCLAEKAGMVQGDFVDVTIESLDEAPRSTEDA